MNIQFHKTKKKITTPWQKRNERKATVYKAQHIKLKTELHIPHRGRCKLLRKG